MSFAKTATYAGSGECTSGRSTAATRGDTAAAAIAAACATTETRTQGGRIGRLLSACGLETGPVSVYSLSHRARVSVPPEPDQGRTSPTGTCFAVAAGGGAVANHRIPELHNPHEESAWEGGGRAGLDNYRGHRDEERNADEPLMLSDEEVEDRRRPSPG